MARNQTAVDCFFCGEAPCRCNQKTRKPAKPKSNPVPVAAKKTARKFATPSIKIEVPQPPPTPEPEAKFKVASEDDQPIKSQEDLEFEAALRNLGPILADGEKRRYPEIFGPTRARHERQVITWRGNNGLL